METDRRPFYIWVVVLLANIGTILIIRSSISINYPFFELKWILIPLGISLLLSVAPVLISRSNSRLKNHFGYGIPVLLLLPLPYFIYDSYTCTGKFCGLDSVIFGFVLALSAVIFALFYTVGIYARKWPVKFVLSLIWIEIILLIGFVFKVIN